MARYPDYQVYSEEPAHTKPISFGLANCQPVQIAKDANLLMSPSLRACSQHRHQLLRQWLLPYGRIRICPVQWQLRLHWNQKNQDPSHQCKQHSMIYM